MKKIYLICNNSLINNLDYHNKDLDKVRSVRPLSTLGDNLSRELCNNDELCECTKIVSSMEASTLATSKYISNKYSLDILVDSRLNDQLIGNLNNKKLSLIKNMQEHDLNYKLSGGESINEVKYRMTSIIDEIIKYNENTLVFTNRRSIMAYLLNYSKVGYSLDDDLILTYNDKVIYTDSYKELDIYELIIENNKVVDINLK